MPHLACMRPGWENEHLASYILSRVAFIAKPMTVADDLGTDLLCTLFDVAEHENREYLVPRNSIAIQVKSSGGTIDATRHLDYLSRLEVPYYVGVADRGTLSLTVYSARYLPLALAYRGQPVRLRLVLMSAASEAYTGADDIGYDVHCPQVTVLRATDTREGLRLAVEPLRRDSNEALNAVVSRLSNEFIFDSPQGLRVLAGEGSATVFRENFHRRLAEVFFNFDWLLRNGGEVDEAELRIFEQFWSTLQGRQLPSYLHAAHGAFERTRQSRAAANPESAT